MMTVIQNYEVIEFIGPADLVSSFVLFYSHLNPKAHIFTVLLKVENTVIICTVSTMISLVFITFYCR